MMRTFDSGATRDSDQSKHDYEGYLSPLALRRFGEYMTKHRVQADGNIRASDNWQKGIPQDAYIKSLFRHFIALWTMHRGYGAEEDMEEALCAIIFNAQGYLHEHLKGRTPVSLTATEVAGREKAGAWFDDPVFKGSSAAEPVQEARNDVHPSRRPGRRS
jgi:hypothetical protein